jgi:dihydrolipoamide dehydrogenase
MADTAFDLIVVGGGPGGYVAAIRASQLGLKTALVEAQHLGGICLNWGCIPTKALLKSAEVWHTLQRLDEFGISADNMKFDLDKMVKRSRGVSAQMMGGVQHLLKKNKVTVFDGWAKLNGPGKVDVEKDGKAVGSFTAKHIILATGARTRTLPGLEADGKLIWTYREALVPDVMPKSLLVVGSGAIGIEFASFFNTLGAEVTVVEVMDRVLPVEDAEISALAHKAFTKHGMKLHVKTTVTKLERGKDNVTATLDHGNGKTSQITTDRVIMAVGITGNVEDIGLETAGIKPDRGHVAVDGYAQTSAPGVYAIGDLAGPPWLAHKASHEGIVCVEKIAGVKDVHPFETSNIPGCTYCSPQVASVGLTEAAATEKGYKVRVGRFPLLANGKAIALGEPDGLIKTVFDDKTGELLGAHMIGAEVTEMIQGYVIARTLETTEAELIHTVFPHPTVSESMHESVLDSLNRAIHF